MCWKRYSTQRIGPLIRTGEAKYNNDPLLIFLGLNIPVIDVLYFIQRMKIEDENNHQEFWIPILVVSSTSGEKGILLGRKSVHNGKSGYTPLVSVAKKKIHEQQ